MDPNELQAVSEALEQLRQGGTVSAETLAKLGGTTQNVNKALEGYTKKLLGVTSAVGGMAKSVADGEGSFKSLGGAIGGLTSVVGKLASAIPLVGGAAKALAEGVGEAAKFVLDQLDTMAKNYQTLGDASATAADGVDGLLRQFNNMGNYSLPAFAKAVKANTTGLAALSGTAAMGAEELAKVSGVLTTGDTARKFLKLGIGLDAVGDATAQYLADSARYGITQGATTDQLTKKTQDYIVEVDKIARLTGQTREQQQREAQKSLVDARFRAKLAEMTANGQKDQADQLRLYVDGLGGAAGDAARALVTGIPLTKEAAEANLFTGDALRQNTQDIIAGNKRSVQAIADTEEAMSRGADTFGTLAQYGKDLGGLTVQSLDAKARIQNKTSLQRQQEIADAQEKTANAAGKTTEELTDAQLATAGASKDLQSLGFSLATYAVPAVNKFATALQSVTSSMNKYLGVGGTTSTPAGVDRGAAGGPRAGMSDSERILATIRQRESGGNYTAQAKGSSASGAYQFIDSTWQNLTKKYGIGQEFGKAKLAPKEIQDAIAQAYVKDILKEAGGDVSKVPLAWYTGNIQGKISQSALAANSGLTPETYQSKWMGEYNKMPAGPGGSYSSSMSGVSYNSAGTSTQAQADANSEEVRSVNPLNKMVTLLTELVRTEQQAAAYQRQILQNSKA
jgi:hypothetical protein